MGTVAWARPLVQWTWQDAQLDRAFRRMVREWKGRGLPADRFFERWPSPLHVEEVIENGVCVIRAELPGIDPDRDVDVQVTDGAVRIRVRQYGGSGHDRPEQVGHDLRYSLFDRRIRRGDEAGTNVTSTSYHGGLLEVRVPVPAVDVPEDERDAIDDG